MTSSPQPDDIPSSWHESDTAAQSSAGGGGDVVLTRSEQQLHVSTVRIPVTRVRFRKRVVTETRTVTIEVSREELVVDHEPVAGSDGETSDPSTSPVPQELEIILYEQRPVITMETVAVERIRVRTRTVTEDRTITEPVGKEQIELHRDPAEPSDSSADHRPAGSPPRR